MPLDNVAQPEISVDHMKPVFKLKDGLLEYTKNGLTDEDRERALGRLLARFPDLDPKLREMLERPRPSTTTTDDENNR